MVCMKAGSFIFRFRMLLMAILIAIGFTAPWIELWGIGSRMSLLEWLGLHISRLGLLSFSAATAAVIVCGALVAALGAILRIWGSAWLGHGIVINANMQSAHLMADGPFRYVRNPLYMGMYFVGRGHEPGHASFWRAFRAYCGGVAHWRANRRRRGVPFRELR